MDGRIPCPYCGTENKTDRKYCWACEWELATTPEASATRRVSRLHASADAPSTTASAHDDVSAAGELGASLYEPTYNLGPAATRPPVPRVVIVYATIYQVICTILIVVTVYSGLTIFGGIDHDNIDGVLLLLLLLRIALPIGVNLLGYRVGTLLKDGKRIAVYALCVPAICMLMLGGTNALTDPKFGASAFLFVFAFVGIFFAPPIVSALRNSESFD